MGLEDFTSDDNEVSDTDSTSVKPGGLSTGNSPGYAKQCFVDDSRCSPRAIKYEIQSYGTKWIKQFSTRRIEEGEVVMYLGSRELDETGTSLAVFTCILSAFDRPEGVDRRNMWVVKWDMEKNEPIQNGVEIKPQAHYDDVTTPWKDQLESAIMDLK